MAAAARMAVAWRPPWQNFMASRHDACVKWWGAGRHSHGGGHPNSATRPTTQLMQAWQTAMQPPLLPRGGPRLSGRSVALPATTISSQTSFLSPHNLFALPLPYSSRYPLPSSTCEVPIGTCQVFRLRSGLRALNGILLVCSVVRVICVVGVC